MPRALAVSLLLAVLAISCGKKGPPKPPVPRGPLPPQGVEARQEGSDVIVSFVVPKPRGPKPSQVPARVELLRVEYAVGARPGPDPDGFRRRGHVIDVGAAIPLDPGSRRRIVDPTVKDLPDHGARSILRYGVRVLDPRGRPSPLVVTRDLEPVAELAPPTGLRGSASADGIHLEWSAPPERAELHYNVYRSKTGEPPGLDPINHEPLDATEFLDTQIQAGTSFTYAVRTSAPGGKPYRESTAGESVTVAAEDRLAPAAPGRLAAVQEGSGIRLLWNPSPETDLVGYRVYRRVGDDDWQRIGPDLVDHPAYLDQDVQVGQHLAYRVTAVDRAVPSNESAPSETAEADVGVEPPSPGKTP